MMKFRYLGLLCAAMLIPLAPARAAAPANDLIQNAEVIPVAGSTPDVLFGSATASASDPKCGAPVYQTVWYRYTPTQDNFIVAQTATANIQPPRPRVSVWTGTPDALVAVQCNSDADAAEFSVRANVTYYIQVAQHAPTPQQYPTTLSVFPLTSFMPPRTVPPPAADLFWFATPHSAPFTEVVDLAAAIAGFYDPAICSNTSSGNSVWQRFVPSVSGSYDAVLENAPSPLFYAAVFTGAGSLDPLQPYTCSKQGDSKPGGTRFSAVAGQTYYIQYGTGFLLAGSLPTTLTVRPTPIPVTGAASVAPQATMQRHVSGTVPLTIVTDVLVSVSYACDQAISDPVTMSATITQGSTSVTATASGDCSSGRGVTQVDIRYVGYNPLGGFHRGEASVTATVSSFDVNYRVTSAATSVELVGQ